MLYGFFYSSANDVYQIPLFNHTDPKKAHPLVKDTWFVSLEIISNLPVMARRNSEMHLHVINKVINICKVWNLFS